NTEPKIIIVPDRGVADYLQQEVFPGSTIEKLDVGIPEVIIQKKGGRPKKHRDANERQRQYQRKKKLALSFKQSMLEVPHDSAGELHNENSIEVYTGLVTTLPAFGTIYKTIRSPLPLGYVTGSDMEGFVDLMR